MTSPLPLTPQQVAAVDQWFSRSLAGLRVMYATARGMDATADPANMAARIELSLRAEPHARLTATLATLLTAVTAGIPLDAPWKPAPREVKP